MTTAATPGFAEALGLVSPTKEGAWAPFVQSEPIKMLAEEVGLFVLLAASVRENIQTEHGLRDAVDLLIATTKPGISRTFSGFSAGIVGQTKRQTEGNLPALVRIVEQSTGKGNPTTVLEPLGLLPPGATPEAIAAIVVQLPVPLQPVSPGQSNEIPY